MEETTALFLAVTGAMVIYAFFAMAFYRSLITPAVGFVHG